ncbi:hypothetical protein [Limnobacter sp.]
MKNTIKIRNFIWITALLFLLMPYVSPIKLDTDVQPFSIILIFSAWLLSRATQPSDKLTFQRSDAILIVVAVIYLITTLFTEFKLSDLLKTGGLLATIILSTILKKTTDENIKNAIHIYSVLIAIVTIAYLFGFSEYFHNFYNYKEITGSRGLSVLTPEPTDLAYTSAIIYISYINLQKKQIKLVKLILLTSIVLTGSLLGIIILIYFTLKLASLHAKKTLLLLVFIISTTIHFTKDFNREMEYGVINRVASIVEKMNETNAITAILNTSAYYRIVMIDSGICASLNNFLIPQGYGQFQANVSEIDRECRITKRYSEHIFIYDPMYIYSIENDMKVNLAKLVYELGFIGLICIFLLLNKVKKKKHGIFAVILYLVQSTPLGHPTIALILRK